MNVINICPLPIWCQGMNNYAHLNSSITPLHIQHIEAETNGCHFADDRFKCIFLKENVRILIKISLKFVPKGQMNNIPALVQIMAWRRPGDKPLSEPMMVSLLHICVTLSQWVKLYICNVMLCKTSTSIWIYFLKFSHLWNITIIKRKYFVKKCSKYVKFNSTFVPCDTSCLFCTHSLI